MDKKFAYFTLFLCLPMTAHAGLFDSFKNFVNKEVIPTITGERPLDIDPNRLKISEGGEKIFEVDLAKDELYLNLGDVTLQTGDLRKDLARAGAIFAGDTAVLTQVMAEQMQQQLAKYEQEGLVTISITPPQKIAIPPEIAEMSPIKVQIGREVILYNQTPATLNYALNDEIFELASGQGIKHMSDEFFLQFDDDINNELNIARYYLTGKEYGLVVMPGDEFISIKKYK